MQKRFLNSYRVFCTHAPAKLRSLGLAPSNQSANLVDSMGAVRACMQVAVVGQSVVGGFWFWDRGF